MKTNEIFETSKLCKLTVNSDFCHAQTHIQYKKKQTKTKAEKATSSKRTIWNVIKLKINV